ncbi:unnamed protein product [Coffea canephora]|uniref:DH200=94 genomic scaffold, scaffold_1048 n=1 Tax=Coffea canephora TaxID=49390 RepID=A0A068VHS5_COFCA|nr:unnamed protein product [Coffea canephora]
MNSFNLLLRNKSTLQNSEVQGVTESNSNTEGTSVDKETRIDNLLALNSTKRLSCCMQSRRVF